MKTQVIDNFIERDRFQLIQENFLGPDIPWHFQDGIVLPGDGRHQFIHLLYTEYCPRSGYFNIVEPIFRDLGAASIVRCKANLQPRGSEIIENDFHTDFKNCVTAILYINSNDGYTLFDNGDKIESVANRVVVFDSNLEHTGTNCTDEPCRVVINFNFHPHDIIPR